MKTRVVVSRKWQQPAIEAFVSDEEIGANMDLNDFIQALVQELDPANTDLAEQLKFASIAVLDEMKKATISVLGDK